MEYIYKNPYIDSKFGTGYAYLHHSNVQVNKTNHQLLQPPSTHQYPPSIQPSLYYQNQTILIQVQTAPLCPLCNNRCGLLQRTKVGNTALIWGTILFLTTGFLCCIPCLIPQCLDKQYFCSKCYGNRGTTFAKFF